MGTKRSTASTIYDVAARAGVSHATVSRYLGGFEGIRPGTRERVAHALAELNYRPNLSARTLATNKSHRIAVLTGDLTSAGPSLTVQGIARSARAAGYVVDIVSFDVTDPDSLADAIGLMRSQDLAGVIALTISDAMRDAISTVHIEVPMHLDSGPADLPGPVGTSFNAAGIHLIVDHLAALGHRNIAHVTGSMDYFAAQSRATAFEEAIRRNELPQHPAIVGDWTSRSGYEALQRSLIHESVTAIVAGNDQAALGILRALNEAGINCPGDVSVTGFDDIPEAEYYSPPLTTVRIDFESQGTFLFATLMSEIEGTPAPDGSQFMHPKLIVRSSTAAPRGR